MKDSLVLTTDCFFRLDDDAYEVIKLESPYVDELFICNNHKVLPWGQSGDVQRGEVDFFREYSIDELDREVVKVVYFLNEFSPFMKTTGSCSGHGKGMRGWRLIFTIREHLVNSTMFLVHTLPKLSLPLKNALLLRHQKIQVKSLSFDPWHYVL